MEKRDEFINQFAIMGQSYSNLRTSSILSEHIPLQCVCGHKYSLHHHERNSVPVSPGPDVGKFLRFPNAACMPYMYMFHSKSRTLCSFDGVVDRQRLTTEQMTHILDYTIKRLYLIRHGPQWQSEGTLLL